MAACVAQKIANEIKLNVKLHAGHNIKQECCIYAVYSIMSVKSATNEFS
jgi:hypothetical protein